VQVH